jgi:hypothetical protein
LAERVVDLGQRGVHVRQRQAREQAEPVAAPSSFTARASAARSAAEERKATPGEEMDSAAAAMPTSSIIATAAAASHSGSAGMPSG